MGDLSTYKIDEIPQRKTNIIIVAGNPTTEEITSKTWDDIKTFDDCILPRDAKVIKSLKERIKQGNVCPCLKLEGKLFYFCGKNMTEESLYSKLLTPISKKYDAHIGTSEMQLFCIDNYKNCNFYNGVLKR